MEEKQEQGPIVEIAIRGFNNHIDDLGKIYFWVKSGNIEVNCPKENKNILELSKNILEKVIEDLTEKGEEDAQN